MAGVGAASRNTRLAFREHVRELRGRLTWVAVWFIVVTAAIFPFYLDIIKLLMYPLGNEKLYYLTPMGGIGFAVKVCMYVGMIVALPVLVYQLYRFVAPVMRRHSAKQAAIYMLLSALLAAAGVCFAYFVSLPSALKFLTGFNIGDISAMLTVDAYLSFIITYILANAIMFQIPLLMVVVDKITPTPPSTWNKFQRHMIVAAFIVAMLISPSPELTTQAMIAAPIIAMYQFGIGLVWFRHRSKRANEKQLPMAAPDASPLEVRNEGEVLAQSTPEAKPIAAPAVSVKSSLVKNKPGMVDVAIRYTPRIRQVQLPVAVPARPKLQQARTLAQQAARSSVVSARVRHSPRATMDGVFRARVVE